MSHLEVYPFLQVLVADGTVAVQVHTYLILRRSAALLNYKGIRTCDSLTQMDVTEELPSGTLPIGMWPGQQRVMVQQDPLAFHRYLQLVKNSIEELLELL